jgi:fructose-bisphosphate aldolase class I
MNPSDGLQETISMLLRPGMGLLAADESLPTIERRFAEVGVESTPESRRVYRELLFTAPGIGEQISGVILYDETLRDGASDGTPYPELVLRRGAMPGIKVDLGAKPLALAADESVTEGLDGLSERLQEYKALGARFTKWRAVLKIGPGMPSDYCLAVNAHALARFAALSQEAGLVPIVEPEVLMDGDHPLERAYDVSVATQRALFSELARQRVVLEYILLKPNMVLPGRDSVERPSVTDVASATLRCLRNGVPPAVPGIVFLSGGQSPEDATAHLNAMNALGPHPWVLSFSFARALQDPVLAAWRGDASNVGAAQAAFGLRARLNGLAQLGRYDGAADTSPSVRRSASG